jgi:hypothetical protein
MRMAGAVACARFDASQFVLPQILAEPIQGQAKRHASFSPQTPVGLRTAVRRIRSYGAAYREGRSQSEKKGARFPMGEGNATPGIESQKMQTNSVQHTSGRDNVACTHSRSRGHR